MKSLLNGMCCYNPDNRYDANQVLVKINELHDEILEPTTQNLLKQKYIKYKKKYLELKKLLE